MSALFAYLSTTLTILLMGGLIGFSLGRRNAYEEMREQNTAEARHKKDTTPIYVIVKKSDLPGTILYQVRIPPDQNAVVDEKEHAVKYYVRWEGGGGHQ